METSSLNSVLIALFYWLALGGILYTYFGYPILVFLLGKLVGKTDVFQHHEPTVTLLIAAYNEEIIIERHADSNASWPQLLSTLQ